MDWGCLNNPLDSQACKNIKLVVQKIVAYGREKGEAVRELSTGMGLNRKRIKEAGRSLGIQNTGTS